MSSRTIRDAWEKVVCAAPAVLVVLLCCGTPVAWVLLTVIRHPAVLVGGALDSFRAVLLVRTLACNLLVGVLATLLALPMAGVIGRGRGRWAMLLQIAMPAVLFMPLLTLEYGWLQFLRLIRPALEPLGVTFEPGGWLDAMRCVWTLAAWLWAVPALIIGMSLRQLDPAIQECALLDGAAIRTTLRQLLGPIVASIAVVTVLAAQDFAVYEPTGINVVATEVRMVFSSGAFSSLPDRARESGTEPLTQEERAAASVIAATPLLLVTLLLAGVAAGSARRFSVEESVNVGAWSPRLDAPWWILALASATLLVCVGLPCASLVASLGSAPTDSHTISEMVAPICGSLCVLALMFLVALLVAFSAASVRLGWLWPIGILSFLLGGELLAIAFIRLFNGSSMALVRDSLLLPTAYLGRFVWIALVIAAGTWTKPWDDLRKIAALEGASRLQTAVRIVWPLSWPMLLAAGLLIAALSLTEVSATAIIIPQHPPVLTTQLLTWAHKGHFGPMIEVSLLSIAAVTLLGAAASALVALISRRFVLRDVETCREPRFR